MSSNGLRPPREALTNLVPYDAKEINARIVLASNENPLNMPKELQERISDHLPRFQFNRYPDATAPRLREMIAQANGVDPDNVLIGNGGDEIIMLLFQSWGGPKRKMLNFPPTFAMYEVDAQVSDTQIVSIPRLADFSIDEEATFKRLEKGDIDLIFIANPNNPTGNLTDESFLIELLERTDALVCVDEAYFEFSRSTIRPHLDRFPNLVILRTFSKAFSLAALRVGYVLGHADVIRQFKKVRQPYSVSAFSQWAAQMVYRNRMMFEGTIEDIVNERDRITAELKAIDSVEVFKSEANYVMFRTPFASIIWRDLLYSYSIYIRDFTRTPGLEDCLRVTVGSPEDNSEFLSALKEIIEARQRCDSSENINSNQDKEGEEDE